MLIFHVSYSITGSIPFNRRNTPNPLKIKGWNFSGNPETVFRKQKGNCVCYAPDINPGQPQKRVPSKIQEVTGMNKFSQKIVSFICMIAIAMTIVVLPNAGSTVEAATLKKTREEAVQWCKNKIGKAGVDYDNYAGVQCVDLIREYTNWLGKDIGNGNAYEYATKAIDTNYFDRYGNDTNPQPGDIFVMKANQYGAGSYGHVGVIYNVGSDYYEYIDYLGSTHRGAIYQKSKGLRNYNNIIRPHFGHTHDYSTPSLTKAPTASSTGTWTLKCSCGATQTVTIPEIKDAGIKNGVYRIQAHDNTNMYVSVKPYQCRLEGEICLYRKNVADQQYRVQRNSDGTYTFYYSQFCLEVTGGAFAGKIQLYTPNGSDKQKWYIVSTGDGYYRIVNKATYYNLDVTNNDMTEGTRIMSWYNNGNNAQKFKLEFVECIEHSWDSGKVTKQPGVGTTGTKEYKCTTCGQTKTETIPALISVNDLSISVDSATYTGSAVKPAVKVTYNSKTLVNGTDYTLSYSDNDKVGTGKVTITGKGSYSGTRTVSFTISEPTYSWKSVSGKWYLYDNTGRMITGFMTLDGQTYYMDSNGVMLTEWQQINGIWYYFGASGVMRKGWQKISGSWYFFDLNSGNMMKDWQQIGGVWYYFGGSGTMKSGWQKIGGTWYCFESNGHMAKGWQKLNNVWYYFGDSGTMKTGWQKIGGSWYYFASSGVMQTGWLNLSGKWYWLGTAGSMAYSTGVTIKGKTYYFDSNGICLNP